MNKEARCFFGLDVSFDETKLRALLSSQLGNERYMKEKKKIVDTIFDKSKDYDVRVSALNLIFKHLTTQGVVMCCPDGLTTSEMLKIMRDVL